MKRTQATSKKWLRRLAFGLAITFLLAGSAGAGVAYVATVNKVVYDESVSHLNEIYRQSNESLSSTVRRNWNAMHAWTKYLEEVNEEAKVLSFLETAKQATPYTGFYFVSHDGGYYSLEGQEGRLDLGDTLLRLLANREDIVATTPTPMLRDEQTLMFAVPATPSTFRGFDYEAIAINFSNKALVSSLQIASFENTASSFVIHEDGRVILDSVPDEQRKVYNINAMLRKYSDLNPEEITEIEGNFRSKKTGAFTFAAGGEKYYFVHMPVGFEDWLVVGIVPVSVVNAAMNNLQSMTIALVSSLTIAIALFFIGFFYYQGRRKLKKKDLELQYREELFAKLSISVDDIFFMIDYETAEVNYVSPNVERLSGISEDVIRKDIRSALDGAKDKGEFKKQISGLEKDASKEWDQEFIHAKTGDALWFHVSAFRQDVQGMDKLILVLSDRTHDKQVSQTLEEAVFAAESASRAKTAFLSNISHDIRTPMNAIVGFSNLAESSLDDPAKVQDYLGKIQNSSSNLLALINDVLDMSRIESGKIKLENSEVHLPNTLHELSDLVGHQAIAKNLHFYVDTTEVLHETVFCDKIRLNQLLLNLLSNAIKFTPS
ncbi:MAG: histidine kinase dimerization/phospho-acceptor domain-containing protein, partial [Candidatus Enteromonas sp.]